MYLQTQSSNLFCELNYVCTVMSSSLQPMHCSPPGSSVHGISRVRILECELPVPPPGGLPGPGMEPGSPVPAALAGGFFTTEPPRSFPVNQLFASGDPEYWSFSFSISPFNEYSGLTSFRMDWFDLLAVQGTLMSLLQHHSSKASILQHSALFVTQLSHPYMATGETTDLTRWTFVGKVMSLLYNFSSKE